MMERTDNTAAALSAPAKAEPVAGRGRFAARVLFNRPVCREHFQLRLRIAGGLPATRPGQFVQLGCRPPVGEGVDSADSAGIADIADADAVMLGEEITWMPGERVTLHQPELCGRLALLRRPFSLAGRGDTDGASGRATWIDIVHRVVGAGTDWLAKLEGGDAVDLIGPLGNAFQLPRNKCLALLVGGGVGLPPMFYLVEQLRASGWDAVAFVGALTRDLLAVRLDETVTPNVEGLPLLCVEEFARYGYPSVVTTDDGSLGLRGRITEGLSRLLADLPDAARRQAVVFTCGPEPMMHAVADLAAGHGVDCQVCLEQAMACGMGTCQSCIVRIEEPKQPHGRTLDGRPWRYRLACTDGPVFAASQVLW